MDTKTLYITENLTDYILDGKNDNDDCVLWYSCPKEDCSKFISVAIDVLKSNEECELVIDTGNSPVVLDSRDFVAGGVDSSISPFGTIYDAGTASIVSPLNIIYTYYKTRETITIYAKFWDRKYSAVFKKGDITTALLRNVVNSIINNSPSNPWVCVYG